MKRIFYLLLSSVLFWLAFQQVVLAAEELAKGEAAKVEDQNTCHDLIQSRNLIQDKLNENDFSGMSAGEVFIQFAKNQLGEKGLKPAIGTEWEQKVKHALNGWSVSSAVKLLNFLNERIGKENTLKRIKSLSYFQWMRWESFSRRVLLYEEYIGEAGINFRLLHSLGGFDRGSVDEIRQVIKFIEGYIGLDSFFP